MFICRPSVPQLDLDLVEVKGGGSTPTQFWARTADGSPVYIRYRGATLRVYKGSPGDPENSQDMELLLNETIGPILHGVILLEQVCDLTGITVRGEKLALSEEAWRQAVQKEWIIDFSGRRVFWERSIRSTFEGTSECERRLRARFPSLATVVYDYRSGCRLDPIPRDRLASGVFGIDADPAAMDAMLASTSLQPAAEDAFTLAIQWVSTWNLSHDLKQTPQERAAAGFRRTLPNDLGWTPALAPSMWGSFRAVFPSASTQARELLDQAIEVMDSCYGNRVSRFDLATGEHIDTLAPEVWQSNDLREWCRALPDRYLSIGRGLGPEDASKWRDRWVGYRPA
jgi:hypothetical protein